VRRDGREGSVVPASPTNSSSDAVLSCHSDRVDFQPGITVQRTPTSEARVRTKGLTASTGWVVPRASLEWKP
jgi:hypothetical protein